jgi:high-affinity iron transporter
MLNVLLVVWRECFEAALVIGILAALATKNISSSGAMARKAIPAGIGFGIFLAFGLGAALQLVEGEVSGLFLEHFQTSLIAVAAILMIHMCVWMRKHGRTLKSEMEVEVTTALNQKSNVSAFFSVAIIAALAVAREGAEIVLFLYGMGVEAASQTTSTFSLLNGMSGLVFFAFLGFGLSIATYFALKKGLLFFSQRTFFKVTEIALFITAMSMVLGVTRRLMSSGIVSPIRTQVWDTSFFLDETSTIGSFVSMLTGYESKPSLTVALVAVMFWICVYFLMHEKKVNTKSASALSVSDSNTVEVVS